MDSHPLGTGLRPSTHFKYSRPQSFCQPVTIFLVTTDLGHVWISDERLHIPIPSSWAIQFPEIIFLKKENIIFCPRFYFDLLIFNVHIGTVRDIIFITGL